MIQAVTIQLSSGNIYVELTTPVEDADEAEDQAIEILKKEIEQSKVAEIHEG